MSLIEKQQQIIPTPIALLQRDIKAKQKKLKQYSRQDPKNYAGVDGMPISNDTAVAHLRSIVEVSDTDRW
jgi:hypothetical protein